LLVAPQDRLRCGEALVEEEAYVFIAGCRQKELDEAYMTLIDSTKPSMRKGGESTLANVGLGEFAALDGTRS
jgi:hypothetical protein